MTTLHQSAKRYIRKKKYHYCPVKSLKKSPQKKAIIVKLRITSPKKPNSAKRRIAKAKLSNKFFITGRIIGQGHNLQVYSTVLVRGGRANDLPGVRYTFIKGLYSFDRKEDFMRKNSLSKYGYSRKKLLEDLTGEYD